MNRNIFRLASLLGALAVVLGAFGAHKLKQLLPPEAVAVFDTAVRYQFYHVFALFCTGFLSGVQEASETRLKWAGIFFVAGILFFSGSLYVLTALKVAGAEGFRWIGIFTPIGGIFFITGWLFLLLALPIQKKTS